MPLSTSSTTPPVTSRPQKRGAATAAATAAPQAADAAAPPPSASPIAAPAAPNTPSKPATVIKLLCRARGATIAEIGEPTGWQPHNTRA